MFWGHLSSTNQYKTLTQWFSDVKAWNSSAKIETQRTYTKVGLE